MRNIIITLGMIILFFNCDKEKRYCGSNDTSINNEILELRKLINEDVTESGINGKIFTKSLLENDTLIENKPEIYVSLRDIKTDSVFITTTSQYGYYNLTVPASKYELEVAFNGYNNLIINNLRIETGNHLVFCAIIGQGSCETEYNWNKND